MKIAAGQIDTTPGDLDGNAILILEDARRAASMGADIVLFPELALPGYPAHDLLDRPAFVDACQSAERQLIDALPAEIIAVFGNVRRRRSPPERGRALHNSAIVARRGEVLGMVAKTLLPTYDVFDEARYFEPAPVDQKAVFELAGHRIGVTICEDLWNGEAPQEATTIKGSAASHRYHRDPMEEVAQAGVDVVLNLSASPWCRGKLPTRQRVLSQQAQRHGVWLAYVNLVGGNDSLIFDGRSMLHGPDGKLAKSMSAWVPSLEVFELESGPIPDLQRDRREIEDIRDALVLGVRDYFRKSNLSRAVVGLSGGIDSAVTAYIAVEALGAESVIGVGMPSHYSSPHSVADAKHLAERLGVRFELLPVAEIFESMLSVLRPTFDGRPEDVTEENLQSRIRGVLLMAIANKHRAVVLGTGNKSEAAMGYATLYGDTIGALSVLADLYKHQVYALARLANEDRLRVPWSTINKPPSAELRPNQVDADSLPPYAQLDAMLEQLIEKQATAEQMAAHAGVSIDIAENVAQVVASNEFKRRQLPPTLRVSSKSWGGRRLPIAQRFRR